MIFKKKYPRSEWMEGLLWAENAIWWNSSNKLFVEHADGMQTYDIYTRRYEHEKPWMAKANVSLEFGQGVLDYIEFVRGKSENRNL
jgi:hypothetical protein